MTENNLFSNVPATNGLAWGYGSRSHKRKCERLRLAPLLLLVAVASLALIDKAHANYIWECQDDIVWKLGAQKDATMMPLESALQHCREES